MKLSHFNLFFAYCDTRATLQFMEQVKKYRFDDIQ